MSERRRLKPGDRESIRRFGLPDTDAVVVGPTIVTGRMERPPTGDDRGHIARILDGRDRPTRP